MKITFRDLDNNFENYVRTSTTNEGVRRCIMYWLINKPKTASKLARSQHGTTRPFGLEIFSLVRKKTVSYPKLQYSSLSLIKTQCNRNFQKLNKNCYCKCHLINGSQMKCMSWCVGKMLRTRRLLQIPAVNNIKKRKLLAMYSSS